jgi:hypothetical protein
MSDPVTRAFFVGRALASVLSEKAEAALTDTLSNIGKFEAEQRENIRQLTTEVMSRADYDLGHFDPTATESSGSAAPPHPADLQETIDDLRAEIARLRSALTSHRT